MTPKLVMTMPGPVDGEQGDVPYRMSFDGASAERAKQWVGEALLASDADKPKPLIDLLKKRPDVLTLAAIQSEVYERWKGNRAVQAAAEGRATRGRPAVSHTRGHLLYYVPKVMRDHKLESEHAAIAYIAKNKKASPLRGSFDSLKAQYYAAKRDRRYQSLLLLDLSREEFIKAAAAGKEVKKR